jgi:hypothetical protein
MINFNSAHMLLLFYTTLVMGGACSHIGVLKNNYNILVGKPEGKRPLGRPRHRGIYNIKMK